MRFLFYLLSIFALVVSRPQNTDTSTVTDAVTPDISVDDFIERASGPHEDPHNQSADVPYVTEAVTPDISVDDMIQFDTEEASTAETKIKIPFAKFWNMSENMLDDLHASLPEQTVQLVDGYFSLVHIYAEFGSNAAAHIEMLWKSNPKMAESFKVAIMEIMKVHSLQEEARTVINSFQRALVAENVRNRNSSDVNKAIPFIVEWTNRFRALSESAKEDIATVLPDVAVFVNSEIFQSILNLMQTVDVEYLYETQGTKNEDATESIANSVVAEFEEIEGEAQKAEKEPRSFYTIIEQLKKNIEDLEKVYAASAAH